jgi:hypothetical protein
MNEEYNNTSEPFTDVNYFWTWKYRREHLKDYKK